MEPDQLRRGKEFHKLVQTDWEPKTKDGPERIEHTITLSALRKINGKARRGRIDVFMEKLEGGDFVSVVEIKATDWDAVKPANRKKLLGSHCRQVYKYVGKYLDDDRVSVCAVMIYPRSPRRPGLKEEVETYLNDLGLMVWWFHDDQV